MDEPITYGFLDSSELNIAAYSDPDFDHSAVPLGHIVTLPEQWLCAAEGPVDGGLIARMEEHEYDQAPVLGSFGVRLVSRATLRALHEAGEPLGPQTRFIEDDALVLQSDEYNRDLLWCIRAVLSRQAVVVLGTPGRRVTPEERAGVLAESKRIEEANMTREWKLGTFTMRPDFYVWGLLTQADLNRKPIRRAIFERLFRESCGRFHWPRLTPTG